MIRRPFGLMLGLLAIGAVLLPMQWAWGADDVKKLDGPQRITRMDGKTYEGLVEVEGDKYVIRPTKFQGMKITLKKSEILKIEALPKTRDTEDSPKESGAVGKSADSGLLSDEQIEELLRGVEIDPSALGDDGGDPESSLPVNETSVADMMRIAGAGADARRLETDHFVFVYTSSLTLARQLASRLEAVYRWNVGVLKQVGLPYKQPEYKLEIYFFGKHDEYSRYQNLLGMEDSVGTLGFYIPDLNRSAFFDMNDWPPIRNRLEQINNPQTPPDVKRRLNNELRKWFNWKNVEVVQHEAAHHIHFNIGVFPREQRLMRPGLLPRWTVEGFATMFELPPTEAGAALGGINHQRVKEFREFFGRDGGRLPPMRDFLLDDMVFLRGGGNFYPLGWAVTHYMWHKKRDHYARWLQAIADLPNRDDFTATERQAILEDIFGEINEQWIKDFVAFIDTIQLKQSILPPDIF